MNRKPLFENEMCEQAGLRATCNACDRIIFEDENYKAEYIETGYCKECNKEMNNVNPFIDTTPEQQHEINKTDLKELATYYGGWDELRKVIYDIEGDEAEASYDSFVNEFYGSDKPVTMKEQHEEAYKTKYLLKNF